MMAGMRAFYFGCWNEPGHYLFKPGGRPVPYGEGQAVEMVDGVHLDANYAPRTHNRGGHLCWAGQAAAVQDRNRLAYLSEEYPQGRFLRHERGGFTLIQWWDRAQGDTRGACNSTILLEGSHDTATMLAVLREHFPHIVENLVRKGIELIEIVK